MTYQFRALAEQAQADGQISAEEILQLRRDGWADGRIEPAEAEAIFVLNDHLAERTPAWAEFFVEAIVQFVLAGGNPRGFISEDQADWLIARLDRDGRVESLAELELLATLFDKAEAVPARLKAYALAQIEQAVLTGEGPTRDGGQLGSAPQGGGASITPAECRLLRRFIFAFAGDGPGGVSRAEAEMLFRIKDATLGASNAPDWPDLFVRGVANHLMAHNRFSQVTADRARSLDQFMNDSSPRLGAFFRRMGSSDLGGNFRDAAAGVLGFGRKGTARDLAGEVAADQRITESEDAWLQQQVDANAQLDVLDQALLKFIAEEERKG